MYTQAILKKRLRQELDDYETITTKLRCIENNWQKNKE